MGRLALFLDFCYNGPKEEKFWLLGLFPAGSSLSIVPKSARNRAVGFCVPHKVGRKLERALAFVLEITYNRDRFSEVDAMKMTSLVPGAYDVFGGVMGEGGVL